ncbi:hypothetical protein GUITHDRAFT_113053 [Guillardia theta CCMP2712]|uniref:Uncharacterized protein n=1 Tax=Guillardia theta (strain CCMP2712) TaxID=905079 RepID=L1IYA5_GUITC|nr:hypothetical protein GUITHDRAFT_113053 [Guillardia theta CCMP2712]EKX40785.1 hypothetical protein GUITHDRAFT_113053 [Guillardia theta CCMP2712]|eukprot:XP_005827765.1 hypothetical protein GUITHDRAFT_113053 [Guillardia theta CCMP2712]
MAFLFGCLEDRKARKRMSPTEPSPPLPASTSDDAFNNKELSPCENDSLITDSTKYWKFEYDDTHVVFVHTVLNIAVELVRKGSGWFHCRDGNQRVYTIYPEGKIDHPRVQVFDAEYMIACIHRDQEVKDIVSDKQGIHLCNWHIRRSEFGHIMITHARERMEVLVLMCTGLCFVRFVASAREAERS